MRTRALASVLLTTVLAGSLGPSAVKAEGMDADTREAKSLFSDGVKLYKAGKFEEARVKFKAAYGLKKRPSILLNLAHAEAQTRRPLEAAAHFREALSLPDIKPEDRDDARGGLDQVRKQLAVVMIDAPAGATISIDGETVSDAPADGLDVFPGAHTVAIRLASGKTTTQNLSLAAGGSATVHAKSEPPPAAAPPPSAPTTPAEPPPPAPSPPPTTPEIPPNPPVSSPAPEPAPTQEPPAATSTGQGFFASIHPVTYVSAGLTVASAVCWGVFWYGNSVPHTNNAHALANYIAKYPNSSLDGAYRAKGRNEAAEANNWAAASTGAAIATGVFGALTIVTLLTMRTKPEEPKVSFVGIPSPRGGVISLVGSF